MPKAEAQALVAIWINVPRDRREAFRKWHNCEHSTDRLLGPGFRALHRYQAEDDTEHHDVLNIFEGDDLDAFGSDYYLNSLNNPTPWTRESMSFIRDAERAVYELLASSGAAPDFDAPYAYAVRLNSTGEPGADEELIAWYREEHLPRLCGVEGVLRARLYRKFDRLSEVKTAESKIQGTRSDERAYMSYIEMSTLAPLGTEAWTEAAFGTPRSAAMRDKLRDLKRERWWLDFAKWAPEE